MSPSPSPTAPWIELLKHVLDDDHRTRRADLLLSHLTTWLIVIGTIVVITAVLLAGGPWWASAGAGGVGILTGLARLRRRRRLAIATPAGDAARARKIVAMDESGTDAPAAG